MRMLIVDDSQAMRTFLQHLGTELNFQTDHAVDGRDGLDKLINNDPRAPFDVALVDWDMPRINGLDLVRMVRRNHDFDSMKVMMVTTQNTMERVTMALQAGADDYLMKPVTREALQEKLQLLGLA